MLPNNYTVLGEFKKYLKNYIARLQVFKELHYHFDIKSVLYPGSYCDVVPSLIFSKVIYVDNYKKTEKFFRDKGIREYINKNKQYPEESNIKFYLSDYRSEIKEINNNYDVLISLSAGYISVPCKKYLKKDGILFVNNDHYDATRAYLEKDYKLIGLFDLMQNYSYSQVGLDNYFKLKSGEKLDLEKLNLLASKPPSRSLKKFVKNSDFYIFKKVN